MPAAKSRSRKKPVAATLGETHDLVTEGIAGLQALADRPVVNDDGTVNTVKIGQRGRTPNRMIDLFELDGKTYQIPEKPSPALMQRFLRDARKKGNAVAASVLLDSLIGDEALDALAESPDVTEEDMAAIYTIVTQVVFGRKAKKVEPGQDPS